MFYNYPLAYLHKLTKAVLGVGLFFLSIVAQAQAPAITSFAPSSGSVGSLITITGTNLSNPTSVSIGGVGAIIISNSSTSIVAMVMPGTVTSIITVTSTGGTVNSSSSFMVIASKPLDVQQGNKLVGTGAVGAANQGYSVSLSADGKTAIIGGEGDNSGEGAVWIYTRDNNGVWAQQGNKLVGMGALSAQQDKAVQYH
jgi:hypothetical protein